MHCMMWVCFAGPYPVYPIESPLGINTYQHVMNEVIDLDVKTGAFWPSSGFLKPKCPK